MKYNKLITLVIVSMFTMNPAQAIDVKSQTVDYGFSFTYATCATLLKLSASKQKTKLTEALIHKKVMSNFPLYFHNIMSAYLQMKEDGIWTPENISLMTLDSFPGGKMTGDACSDLVAVGQTALNANAELKKPATEMPGLIRSLPEKKRIELTESFLENSLADIASELAEDSSALVEHAINANIYKDE
jgi:hypothetical protein